MGSKKSVKRSAAGRANKPARRAGTAAARKSYKAPLRDARAKVVGKSIKLPRAAKGKRAQFYDDPAIDQLMGIVAALTAEVSVAFERVATLERVLAKRGHLGLAEVEGYEPDDVESSERAVAREALIERVFQVLEVTDPVR
jgi:hypothetical protein